MPGSGAKRGVGQARSHSEVADVEVPYFWPECKKQKRGNVRAALAQAIEAAEVNGKGRVPVAFICDDRKEPFVAMREADFFDFVRDWWAGTHPPCGCLVGKPAHEWMRALERGELEASCAAVGDVVRMAINEERDES